MQIAGNFLLYYFIIFYLLLLLFISKFTLENQIRYFNKSEIKAFSNWFFQIQIYVSNFTTLECWSATCSFARWTLKFKTDFIIAVTCG